LFLFILLVNFFCHITGIAIIVCHPSCLLSNFVCPTSEVTIFCLVNKQMFPFYAPYGDSSCDGGTVSCNTLDTWFCCLLLFPEWIL